MDEKPELHRLKLESGEQVYLLGREKTLIVVREDRKKGRISSVLDKILMFIPYEADYYFKRQLLERWFRKQASRILTDKAEKFGTLVGVSFGTVRIKDQKSRWGSCSSKGNLNFNWRILMAPEAVCDYVVIHEVCHLKHMNHSPEFWLLVGTVCPEYRRYRKWLKERGKWLYPF